MTAQASVGVHISIAYTPATQTSMLARPKSNTFAERTVKNVANRIVPAIFNTQVEQSTRQKIEGRAFVHSNGKRLSQGILTQKESNTHTRAHRSSPQTVQVLFCQIP